jgi:hypothetical protein
MLSIRSIEQRLNENDEIQQTANNLRAPLRTKMADTLQQGRTLSTQPNVAKAQYDALNLDCVDPQCWWSDGLHQMLHTMR